MDRMQSISTAQKPLQNASDMPISPRGYARSYSRLSGFASMRRLRQVRSLNVTRAVSNDLLVPYCDLWTSASRRFICPEHSKISRRHPFLSSLL